MEALVSTKVACFLSPSSPSVVLIEPCDVTREAPSQELAIPDTEILPLKRIGGKVPDGMPILREPAAVESEESTHEIVRDQQPVRRRIARRKAALKIPARQGSREALMSAAKDPNPAIIHQNASRVEDDSAHRRASCDLKCNERVPWRVWRLEDLDRTHSRFDPLRHEGPRGVVLVDKFVQFAAHVRHRRRRANTAVQLRRPRLQP